LQEECSSEEMNSREKKENLTMTINPGEELSWEGGVHKYKT
jgi:hypothetical protein